MWFQMIKNTHTHTLIDLDVGGVVAESSHVLLIWDAIAAITIYFLQLSYRTLLCAKDRTFNVSIIYLMMLLLMVR